MKKNIYLIHGWDGSPGEAMHKWIKSEAEKKNYSVFVPKMPNPEKPEIKSWINKIKEISKNFDEEDIFIGHSVGCQAVLRFLETLNNKKVKKIILIAPWMKLDKKTIEEEGEEVKEIAKPWMVTPIDWKKLKSICKNFICIFSDNDPYVPISQANFFKNKLSAKTIILNKRGHFDTSSGVKNLPELLKFLK